MAYMGMCHWTGYGFCLICPTQGIQFLGRLPYTKVILLQCTPVHQ